jgi:SAM-dependent methyltransferase
MPQPDRTLARRLADESLAQGDPLGWFDALYQAAAENPALIPWADFAVNPHLAAWLAKDPRDWTGRRALVVGCGLGDDAEELARLGAAVKAFDVSTRAIEWCRRRFTNSQVDYQVADVLSLPAAWREAFDLVVEIYTLQVLPPELRATATAQLAACVAPGGTLLVVARAREAEDDRGSMPWPLLQSELDAFQAHGLVAETFEDFLDDEQPPVRRFRATYRRP